MLTSASVRVVLALVALTVLPLAYPAAAGLRPLMAGYLIVSLASLLLIQRDVGGTARSVLFGVVDLAVLSYVVHRTGSASGVLVSIYLLACTLNALAVGRNVGLALAAVAAAFYGGLVLAEQLGHMPYAPDAPDWLGRERPPVRAAVTVWAMVSGLTLLAALIAGRLVARIRRHEHALQAANARLEQLSQRDPLTELYNRRHLMACMDRELARVRRGGSLAVVMIDLDGFKRVNDGFGHLRGDALLQEIAAAVARSTRETDVIGRYGGDEFLVIMPDTDGEQAKVAAERLAAGVRSVGVSFDEQQPVTASVGVAVARSDDEVRPVVQRADRAAYLAKQAGGDTVLVSEE